jgi:hypothetical protein
MLEGGYTKKGKREDGEFGQSIFETPPPQRIREFNRRVCYHWRIMASGTTDVPITLHLSDRARSKLAERAARAGQDIAAVASDLIEQAIVRGTVEELLTPFRKQVEESGMSDAELDDFLRGELEARRKEKKAKIITPKAFALRM